MSCIHLYTYIYIFIYTYIIFCVSSSIKSGALQNLKSQKMMMTAPPFSGDLLEWSHSWASETPQSKLNLAGSAAAWVCCVTTNSDAFFCQEILGFLSPHQEGFLTDFLRNSGFFLPRDFFGVFCWGYVPPHKSSGFYEVTSDAGGDGHTRLHRESLSG